MVTIIAYSVPHSTFYQRFRRSVNESIPAALTIVKFFGSAFMSFMAVAYVPAFLEDRATFIKERANGLYGASAFMISNFLIGIPYLCQCPRFIYFPFASH